TAKTLPVGAALGRHAILLATALFMLMPFIWMVSLSVKPPGELFQSRFALLPQTFYGVENYTEALVSVPLARFMANGAFVAFAVLTLQILVAAPCAYALAKLRFAGRDGLFAIVLIALLIPQEVLGLPLFILFHYMGLLDTYAALILPFAVSPFAIFLLRQFFKTVPDDLIHAARLDGLSEWAIVWRIMVPQAMAAIIAFAILSVISRWNNLFWPSIAVTSEELMPPSLGIVFFRNEEAGNAYGPLMAASTLVVAPLVIAFLLAQRRFVEGFQGGVK
ncbi:MAG: carbohydrate ABC transporter permease, partial [Hyphomonas sp.]|nr:carbohydrate ABC transporter permease [Hyphomonas sp.]